MVDVFPMEMRFLPDEPIQKSADDQLGFNDFADLVHGAIRQTTSPFVYGVLGDWGAGKTSILRLLEDRLKQGLEQDHQPLVPIWFNAWKYENESNLVYPLLYTIDADHRRRVPDPRAGFRESFLRIVGASTLALTDLGLRAVTKQLTGEALKLKDVSDHLKEVEAHKGALAELLSGWADQIGRLNGAFEEMLDSYARDLGAADPKLPPAAITFVVIVDDLDRCLPTTAIAVLESIKNFLSVKRCIYVLGINPGIVHQAVRLKYQGLPVEGREYLEKILNYTFYVPEPDPDRVAAFGAGRLAELVLDPRVRGSYEASFTAFGKVLRDCRFYNPRKIKRILNRFLLFISTYEKTFVSYNVGNVVRLIVLAEYFPALFQRFVEDGDEAKQAVVKLGTKDFDVNAYQAASGVDLSAIYSQLSAMRGLLELVLPVTPGALTLTDHARAVYRITRLI